MYQQAQAQSLSLAEQAALYDRLLRSSLCFFSSETLGLEIGPHMVSWDRKVAKYRRLGINAPRDHSKSTFFSYAYPIWRSWGDPGSETYLFSNTTEQAREFLDIILNGRGNLRGISDIDLFDGMMPLRSSSRTSRERMNRSEVRFTNGSRIKVYGYGQAVRGRHPKYCVLDDPLNDEDMYSETVRNKRIEYFKSAISNLVPPTGQICAVGTPMHVADLWGFLRDNPRYHFSVYPAILTDAQGEESALFPWRYTLQDLKERKEEIGSVAFAREILCQPISDDLAIFPSYLFPPLFRKDLRLRPPLEWIRAMKLSVFQGIDIALSANVGADFFVIYTLGVDKQGNRYILDIERYKGLSFRNQLEVIRASANKYRPDLVHVESVSMQRVWSDELIRTSDIPIQPFETKAQNKNALDRGVPSLRVLLENQKLIIPRGDEYSVQTTNTWITEMSQFGFIDGKLQGIGAHDDTVMALWIANEAVKRGGFNFSFGEDEEEEDEEEEDEDWEKEMFGGEDEADS